MDISDETRAAVHALLAKQILEGLGAEHRDAILAASITKALAGYDFHNAIQKVVAAEAEKVVTEMLAGNYWQGRLRESVLSALQHYLNQLPGAVLAAVTETMHGEQRSGGYDRCGTVLRHLKRPEGA